MRAALFLCVTLAACGTDSGDDEETVDCSTVMGADTFTVGLQKMGSGGTLSFKLLSATPAPPARGDNSWLVQIDQVSAAAPLEGATLQVTPFMPAHQHGSPIMPVVTPMPSAGQYQLDKVNLWRPGVGETTFRATAGTSTDAAVYKFCIE